MQKNNYTKQQLNKLNNLRAKLDNFDNEILLLLKKRFKIVKQIGEFKKMHSLSVYDPTREESILKRLSNICKERKIPLSDKNIKDIFLEIFSISRSLEAKQKIAYLGPQGTFCEQKAIEMFGNNANLLPINSINGVFGEVQSDNVSLGLVPLENSLGGMVGDTLYALYSFNLFIISCNDMPIEHSLCSNADKLEDIKKIYSKDIAFLQCSEFLNNHSSLNAELINTSSTTKAIQYTKNDSTSGAICLSSSAKAQGVKSLYENIQNSDENVTKFITISPKPNFQKNHKNIAMLVKMQNKSGALVEFLSSFKKAKIDLNKIESHTINGELVFYIQADTNLYNKKLSKIIKKEQQKKLSKSHKIKILGSW